MVMHIIQMITIIVSLKLNQMVTRIIYKTKGPVLIPVMEDKYKFNDFINSLENGGDLTVILKGQKMHTLSSLYDEFTVDLSFPNYFGRNLDAFEECINDLSWLPKNNYIVGINDVLELLSEEKNEKLISFIDILKNAGNNWNHPKDKTKVAKPFHVLLQFEEKNKIEFKKKFG